MTQRLLVLVLVLFVGGCSSPTQPTPESPSDATTTPTTTGILPSGVPTEGTRPPADTLPPPAEPRQALAQNGQVPGRIVPVGPAPEGIVVDAVTRTLAVAKRAPNELVLLNADTGEITGRTALPGVVCHLQLAAPGGPVLVANELGGTVAAVRGDEIVKVFTDSVQPGGPYGITYDPTRYRLWVASSGTNEVVGYDMSQPTPREVQRIPTVPNPYTVGVDATTGRLFLAEVTDGVVQIVDPG